MLEWICFVWLEDTYLPLVMRNDDKENSLNLFYCLCLNRRIVHGLRYIMCFSLLTSLYPELTQIILYKIKCSFKAWKPIGFPLMLRNMNFKWRFEDTIFKICSKFFIEHRIWLVMFNLFCWGTNSCRIYKGY